MVSNWFGFGLKTGQNFVTCHHPTPTRPGRGASGLGKSMVVFSLFEKIRYSIERSTKFESLYQE